MFPFGPIGLHFHYSLFLSLKVSLSKIYIYLGLCFLCFGDSFIYINILRSYNYSRLPYDPLKWPLVNFSITQVSSPSLHLILSFNYVFYYFILLSLADFPLLPTTLFYTNICRYADCSTLIEGLTANIHI